ncbi:MAG: hypothetical protein WBC91_07780 [Phototrophicaceae bacterium]
MTSDVQWQNYLNEATDAILAGESVSKTRTKYGISYTDDHHLLDLVNNLNQTFLPVEPSAQFSTRLKNDLLGIEQTGVVWRIRRLPARVQWAAIVATLLGGGLIVLQRLTNAGNSLRTEDRTRIPEEG